MKHYVLWKWLCLTRPCAPPFRDLQQQGGGSKLRVKGQRVQLTRRSGSRPLSHNANTTTHEQIKATTRPINFMVGRLCSSFLFSSWCFSEAVGAAVCWQWGHPVGSNTGKQPPNPSPSRAAVTLIPELWACSSSAVPPPDRHAPQNTLSFSISSLPQASTDSLMLGSSDPSQGGSQQRWWWGGKERNFDMNAICARVENTESKDQAGFF